ncbi:MAG: hypothetical protein ACLQF4_00515 [Xanthobacteraceae bacterium]
MNNKNETVMMKRVMHTAFKYQGLIDLARLCNEQGLRGNAADRMLDHFDAGFPDETVNEDERRAAWALALQWERERLDAKDTAAVRPRPTQPA